MDDVETIDYLDGMDAMDFVSVALIQLKKENQMSPCFENAMAILKLESALDLIWDRNKRLLRRVEGLIEAAREEYAKARGTTVYGSEK